MTQSKKKEEKEGHSPGLCTADCSIVPCRFWIADDLFNQFLWEASVDYGDAAYYYLKKQLFPRFWDLLLLAFISRVPYQVWKDLIPKSPSWFHCFDSSGIDASWCNQKQCYRRWLDLKIGLTLQPAEVAKLGIIIYLASIITKLGRSLRTFKEFYDFHYSAYFCCRSDLCHHG